jgi:hypothetical protein
MMEMNDLKNVIKVMYRVYCLTNCTLCGEFETKTDAKEYLSKIRLVQPDYAYEVCEVKTATFYKKKNY